MEELISVIIPIYNVEKYLRKCIESILSQSYKELQIILINDGSSDSSGKICDELLLLDKRIIVVHQKNKGVSAARNKGIELSKGKYISFVDPDDFIEPNMYKILVDNIEKYSAQCSSIGLKKVYESDAREELINNKRILKIQSGEDALDDAISPDDPWLGFPFNKLFIKNILNVYNIRFNEKIIINEDSIFCYEYMSHCAISVRDTTPLYNYLIRDSSVTRTILKDKHKILHLIDSLDILYDFGERYKNRIIYQRISSFYVNVYLQYIFYMFLNGIYDLDKIKICYLKIDKVLNEVNSSPISWKKKIFYYSTKMFPLGMYYLVRLKNF